MLHHFLWGIFARSARAAPVIARTAYFESADGGSSHTATLDPAPANGVLLVACGIAQDWNWSPPAGWTDIVTNRAWYKVASGEGTTFVFSDNGAGKSANGGPVVLVEITGNAASSPIEDTDTATSTATTPAGTSLGPNRLAVALAVGTNSVASMTNSWTISINRFYNTRTAAIGYKTIAATGSTGTSDWSASCSNAITITVKP